MADVNLYSERKIPRRMFPISDWQEGISDFNKKGGSYLWSRGIDYRTEPSQLQLLPSSILEAQAPFVDLGKWATQVVGRTVPIGNVNVPITNNSFEISQNAALVYRGVNLSGLEFSGNFIGTLNTNYFVSSQNTWNYYANKKMAVVRLPFLWERAQPTLGGALDPTYMDIIDGEIVKAANSGVKVILDCHNYGRRFINLDGGITENFTEATPLLQYPYADYSQGGNIVLRDYGEAFLGTPNNPDPPATGYKVSFTLKFNSRDHTFGGEGLYVRPMWTSDNQCYEFAADYADNIWALNKYINGVKTVLATGTQNWGTSNTYTIAIDINQATNGFINVSLNGTPLFTTNSIPSDSNLSHGQVAFYPAGVHAQIASLVLNINGSTSGGGWQQFVIGSGQVPISNLSYFWGLVAQRYATNQTVLGYDLMNEPHDMPIPTTSSNYSPAVATGGGMAQLAIRSVDAMKLTKDNITSQFNANYIETYCAFLAASFNLTHIAISVPLDANADMIANGSTPTPTPIETYLQTWVNAIHAAGLKVLYRGTFCAMENIYNFPFAPTGSSGFLPQGTATSAPTDGVSTWLGKLYQRIRAIGSVFESGDIFAPFPEQTSYVFNGNSFLSTADPGIQTNYYNFFEAVPTVVTAAFASIGITGIITGDTSNNYSELRSGWLSSSFVTAIGKQAVDYYGNYNGDGYTAAQYGSDLSTIYTQNGNTPIFLQEFADLQNVNLDQTDRTTYLNSFYTELASLATAGKLTGFNYWGAWDDGIGSGGEALLTNTGTLQTPIWGLKYTGTILQSYYASNLATVTAMEQACINSIREFDTFHYIVCETDHWAGGQNFTNDYGSSPTPWLTDPAGRLVYSFHYYFDDDHSGTYQQSFAQDNDDDIAGDVTPIMSWAQSNNLLLLCGEYGVPAISAWQVCLTDFFTLCNTYNVWTTYFAGGDDFTSVTSIQPSGSVGNYTDALQMTIVGNISNLVPASTSGSGWTLGSDFFFLNGHAYDGNWSVKQTSVGGTSALTTASGSPITVVPYADYELTFYVNASVTQGLGANVQILGGSLSGANIATKPTQIMNTDGFWMPVTVHFNALGFSQVFISIANQNGNMVANYDYFTLQQINSLSTYALGNAGNLYKRYSDGSWILMASLPNNHGNGLGYYGEDDYLYIVGDYTVSRYGPISSGTPSLVVDYLTGAGGVPTNTASPLLVLANSNYFNLSSPGSPLLITGDIALEAFIKPSTVPAVGSSQTIMGIWKESGNQRAWKFDVFGVSGFFGNGQDSSLTISSATTESPIDSVCSGTVNTNQLNATNSNFAVGQKILVIQMQGPGAGTRQFTTIQGYTAGTITTQDPLIFSFNSGGVNSAQVRVMPQYTNVTINAVYSPKVWNGETGGIIAFYANGTVQGTGLINLQGAGFRGGANSFSPTIQGEGTAGPPNNPSSSNANGNGAGGASNSAVGGTGTSGGITGGGTGGNGRNGSVVPQGGQPAGSSDLTNIVLGGGGSAGEGEGSGAGANGGGMAIIAGVTLNFASLGINVNGNPGQTYVGGGNNQDHGGGGGGAGCILLYCQNGVLGNDTLTALGGVGGGSNSHDNNGQYDSSGGIGGNGIIVVNYLFAVTGATNPAGNAIQSNNLVSTPTTQVRLGISNNGTSFEYLTQNLKNYVVGSWDRLQVSWNSAQSTASFYENGQLIGTAVGTKTAINGSSTGDFAIGGNYTSSAYANFGDFEINDARVWNQQVTQAQFAAYNTVNLGGSAVGLVGNWFTSASPNDLTANGNNLSANGSPTIAYIADVPYAGATTRGDLDQTGGTTANTTALPTSFNESDKTSFTPQQDPQKSIQVQIANKGNGSMTMVVHDGLNNVVASQTYTNGQLQTGLFEFVFPQVYRPVVGATYHFHMYQGGTGATVKSTASNTFAGIYFNTYFQFLVTDYEYHPVLQVGNVLAIGNERYLAVIDASGGALSANIGTYNLQGFNSRRLVLPAGWRIRCLTNWLGYIAIGCWRGTHIKDFDQGMVFIWDGYSVTYIDYFFVAEGGVNAMWGENDILYISAGYHGDILEYTGASKTHLKYKRIPRIGNQYYAEIVPGAMVFWNGLLRIGYSYNSDSPTHEKGVYTWGTTNLKYPESLSFDYPISTGNRFSTVRIGALLPVSGSLLMFYQDGVSYGVNNIDASNPVQTTGTIEELITDFAFVWHEKNIQTVRADHLPLGDGANVDVKYKLDYEANWHNQGIANQQEGAQITRLPLPAGNPNNYHIIQVGIDFYASEGISPVVVEHSQLTDLNLTQSDENQVSTAQVYD